MRCNVMPRLSVSKLTLSDAVSNDRYYLARVVPKLRSIRSGLLSWGGHMPKDWAEGRAWMAVIAECKRTYPWICHLCGQPIPRGVHRNEPLAYQVDHIMPWSTHPPLRMALHNTRPSHFRCNRYRGARPLTPGLIAEITAKYAPVHRPALGFFEV